MNNDYSSKDFTSIYEDLLSIVEASTTLWNPRYSTEADPGVVILKAMALLEDKSNYRFDMSRAQAYLDTVSDRTSAYDLLAMLGYIMQGRRAAEGFITVKNTSSASYTIPQFSVVTNPTKEVLFFTKDSVTVSAGESVSIPVQAGTIFQVVKQGISNFTLKDIDEKGRLFLGKTNLAQNGIYVRSKTPSTKWVYLDYVLLPDSPTYYTVGTSATGEMYVQFPDDYVALIRNDELTVYATYTNGANSNIAKNVLSTFSDNQKNDLGEVQLSSVFSVSQTEDIYSGQDEESIDHAIQTYYETKDVCSTLITAQDFTTALRYLLISNVRAFSNVILETPQTKTKRMMTSQQGVSYVQLVQPNNLDFNRIDVLPTKFSAEYYPSFKPYLTYDSSSYDNEKAKLEAQIDQKLADQKALPIKINIAGFDSTKKEIDKSIQPIFATFSPLIYVYLRDSSITQQVIAREAIKRYFHTTYNMKNLVSGSPLSESKIAEDIKKLSTNIIAVTVVPLDYTMAQFKKEYLADPTAQFSATSSLSKLSDTDNKDLRLSILQDAVLAGDVPLFKFTNRQNSYSKTNSLYSQLTKEEQVLPIPWGAKAYDSQVSFDDGCYLFATKILGDNYETNTHTLTADEMIQIRRPIFVQEDDHVWGQGMRWTYSLTSYNTTPTPLDTHVGKGFTFYVDLNKQDDGLILPVDTTFTPASDFSFEGDLRTYFSSSPIFEGISSTFTGGLAHIVIKELSMPAGTRFTPHTKFSFEGDLTEYFSLTVRPTFNGTNSIFEKGVEYTVSTDLVIPAGRTFTPDEAFSYQGDLTSYFALPPFPVFDGSKSTFKKGVRYTVSSQLTLTGGYLPLSGFNWAGAITPTYYLLLPGTKIESGFTYVMQEGESLTIQKASTQETMATYTAGSPILLANLTITRAPSVTDVLSSAMTTISSMVPKSSTISNEYLYFLCLNSKSSTKNITPTTPYTLEEGEYFIWADAGVTEYVTLGPGTELTVPTGSITLKVHNNYDIASVLPSDFEQLPSPIGANFYEITTFAEGDRLLLSSYTFSGVFKVKSNKEQYFIPSWWSPAKGSRAASLRVTTQGKNFYYTISSTDYSIRHLAVLKTTPEGYALTKSTTFALSSSPDIPNVTNASLVFPPYYDSFGHISPLGQTRLYSSIALSGFAGSLLTTSPFSCTVATVGLIENSQGVYEEQLSDSEITGSKVQGLRITSDSTIPSPYDLKISYSGALTAKSNTTIASFRIPNAEAPTLFRFRYVQGTGDKDVTFKILYYSSSSVQQASNLGTIDNRSNANVLSLADYIFVVPAGTSGSRKLEIQLSSSKSYTEDNPYVLEAAIEDISILDSTTPFDPRLEVFYSNSNLPSQLGGTDVTSEAYNLLQKLIAASNSALRQNKMPFNWLYYSLDRLSNPLDPQSFFLPAHPKNSKVFPLYIEDATKIKFPQRG